MPVPFPWEKSLASPPGHSIDVVSVCHLRPKGTEVTEPTAMLQDDPNTTSRLSSKNLVSTEDGAASRPHGQVLLAAACCVRWHSGRCQRGLGAWDGAS